MQRFAAAILLYLYQIRLFDSSVRSQYALVQRYALWIPVSAGMTSHILDLDKAPAVSFIRYRRFRAGHCEIVIKTAIGDKRVSGKIWDFKVESGQVMSLSAGLFMGRVGGFVLGDYRVGEDGEQNYGGGIFDEWGEHVGVARDDVHFEVGGDKVEDDSAGQCAACDRCQIDKGGGPAQGLPDCCEGCGIGGRAGHKKDDCGAGGKALEHECGGHWDGCGCTDVNRYADEHHNDHCEDSGAELVGEVAVRDESGDDGGDYETDEHRPADVARQSDEAVLHSSGKSVCLLVRAALIRAFFRRARHRVSASVEQINEGASDDSGEKCGYGPEDREEGSEQAQGDKDAVHAGLRGGKKKGYGGASAGSVLVEGHRDGDDAAGAQGQGDAESGGLEKGE